MIETSTTSAGLTQYLPIVTSVYLRLWTIVIAVMLMAAGLLALRQQRINTANELVQLQRQINDERQESWALQVRIGERLRPQWLQEAVAASELALEPDLPAPQAEESAEEVRFAEADGPGDSIVEPTGSQTPAIMPIMQPHEN